jgi:hypothetical protein
MVWTFGLVREDARAGFVRRASAEPSGLRSLDFIESYDFDA